MARWTLYLELEHGPALGRGSQQRLHAAGQAGAGSIAGMVPGSRWRTRRREPGSRESV